MRKLFSAAVAGLLVSLPTVSAADFFSVYGDRSETPLHSQWHGTFEVKDPVVDGEFCSGGTCGGVLLDCELGQFFCRVSNYLLLHHGHL